MSIYYTLPGYTRVAFPRYDDRKVYKFLRETFGDNDIYQAFESRRWITYGARESIYFRDEADAIWFNLKWSEYAPR